MAKKAAKPDLRVVVDNSNVEAAESAAEKAREAARATMDEVRGVMNLRAD